VHYQNREPEHRAGTAQLGVEFFFSNAITRVGANSFLTAHFCSAHVRYFFAYNDLSALRTFIRVLWIVYHVPKDGKSSACVESV
jgi:hypothetical protein